MRVLQFALLIVVLVLAACRQAEPPPAESADLNIVLRVEPEPPATGPSTLYVTVTDGSGAAVEDAQVNARGDMSHAGMVPVTGEGEHVADGEYQVPFEWTMAGDWFVDVTVALSEDRSVQERFDLTVSGEGGMSHDEAEDDHG